LAWHVFWVSLQSTQCFHAQAANMQNPKPTEKLMKNKNLIHELNFDRCSRLINITSQPFSQFNSHGVILCSFFTWKFCWCVCCSRAPMLVLCFSFVIMCWWEIFAVKEGWSWHLVHVEVPNVHLVEIVIFNLSTPKYAWSLDFFVAMTDSLKSIGEP
jgi:hypothetical protein